MVEPASANEVGERLRAAVRETLAVISATREGVGAAFGVREVGAVLDVSQGVARVGGLRDVALDEVVVFANGGLGLVFDLWPNELGVVLLDAEERVEAGEEVRSTGRVIDVPVGAELLGRVLDGVGRPLDRGPALAASPRRDVERPAPPIRARSPVEVPLETGIKAVDALVPVGRGQRELIIGDRQTGKSAVARDAVLNQGGSGVLCVYCAVGQGESAVARLSDQLREAGAMAHTVVVVASGDSPPGLQFLAPYTAMTISEAFMAAGRDVLLVLDDLTKHARAYREISLLLRRPPGREGYPGDIFHVHARLLERSTRVRPELGGGSITALPVVETDAGNIAAYIPTNLISITDGQIYLSPELVQRGIMPAVDIGRSVSRVGGAAQLAAFRAVIRDLRLTYSQFHELEAFSRFSTYLDPDTRRALERGRRVREILRQAESAPVPAAEQVAVLLAATEGVLDEVPLEMVEEAEDQIRAAIRTGQKPVVERIHAGEALTERDRSALLEGARQAVAHLIATPSEADA